MSEHTLIHRAQRAIKAATGDIYPDDYIVMDYGIGSHEHGEKAVWVKGDWNNKDARIVNGQWVKLTRQQRTAERLGDLLERMGVETVWYDEYEVCAECGFLIRTQPNSYSWTPDFVWADDYVCGECLREDPNAYLDDYVNSPTRAVTWLDKAGMRDAGWTQWEADDPHSYEHGWHPGQTDDPETIMKSIHETTPDVEVVFLIDAVGQFDCRFSAWVKGDEDSDD